MNGAPRSGGECERAKRSNHKLVISTEGAAEVEKPAVEYNLPIYENES